jgi:hypothetical protein
MAALLHSLTEDMDLSVIALSLVASVGLGLAGVYAALSTVLFLIEGSRRSGQTGL